MWLEIISRLMITLRFGVRDFGLYRLRRRTLYRKIRQPTIPERRPILVQYFGFDSARRLALTSDRFSAAPPPAPLSSTRNFNLRKEHNSWKTYLSRSAAPGRSGD